jgi:hypothetical protein
MPAVSQFYGIVIYMYFEDHNPPHFHAEYGEHEVLIEIESLQVYAGSLPRKGLGLVLDWAELHQQELRDNWNRLRKGEPVARINPLP